MYRILLVEDDRALAESMKQQLECYGNEVVCITDFRSVTDEFRQVQPHLVLMDIMLPYKDGYFWCNEIRRISGVPIVFISSASDSMNIVMAINMGGDDFIPKPVDAMVLNAKVQAVLRRTYELTGNASVISFRGAKLNMNDGSIIIGEKRVELTKNEFRILMTLLENRGSIVSRDTLMMKLWQDDCYVEENTLTVNVARLRRKLEENGLENVIVTRPGSGYIIQ
ncbi:MAG: DNA-binding response regulator [Clostridiales bacterium]|jgi:Response regulators consisting of a CheY-like receiver domain and a winged-helix DNA-binding domain|nr:DNA-binding response regulator [Clostridiales bacterium]